MRAKLRAHVQGFLLHRPSQPQTCLASCLKGKRDSVPVLTLSLDPAPHLIALGILSSLEAALTPSSLFTSVILEQQWMCTCTVLYLVLKRCMRKETHTPLLSHLKFHLLKLKDQGPGAAANVKEPCLSRNKTTSPFARGHFRVKAKLEGREFWEGFLSILGEFPT